LPTIEVLFNDLQRLVGKSLPHNKDALTDTLAYVKGEVESIVGDELSIELKDGNRPDLWSVEGIARELKGALGIETGLKEYKVEKEPTLDVLVDPKLESIRPYIGCSVVKSVHIDDESIRELMHLQDKLDQTYGRKRRRTSIGFYRFGLIHPPLHYRVTKPKDCRFVPLDRFEPMTLEEILKEHPKGIEYGQIVSDFAEWPILVDAKNQVLSFPPVINSNNLGKITNGDQDILVEVTGTDYQSVLNVLTIVTLSLADRGKEILSSRIKYPYGPIEHDETPKLGTRQLEISPRELNKLLGLNLKSTRIVELLKKARYNALDKGDVIDVTVPCYRTDIMHPIDIMEDVAISYGFNNISPEWPDMACTGELDSDEEYSNTVREIMTGLGFQEVLTFSLTDRENQLDKMGLDSMSLAEVTNPSNVHLTSLRGWLIPGLMAFLANNTHALYPQKIFEVGDCQEFGHETQSKIRDVRKLAAVISHSEANFSEIRAVTDAFFMNIGLKPDLREFYHPSFITGRVCEIVLEGKPIGMVGEFSPKILENWKMSNPAVGFEVNVERLKKMS
jgi:phenylalanyl-tRNA synthetase beta chain